MKLSLFFIGLALFSAESAAKPKSQCTLSVPVIEAQYSANHQAIGLANLNRELLQLLATAANCDLRPIKLPWSRGIAMLKAGELDLMMTMSKSAEREQFADYIGSHSVEVVVLILHKDYLSLVKSLPDITHLPGQVAVLREGFYGDRFHQLQQISAFRDKLLYANNVPQKLSLLEHNRVVGLIEERTQYQLWAEHHQEQARDYREHLVLNHDPVYFAASRKGLTQHQRDHLRRSWATVFGSDAHKAILAKYGWSFE